MSNAETHYDLILDGETNLAWRLIRFEVFEALSETYRAKVVFTSPEPLSPLELRERPAHLVVRFVDETERNFHGAITEIEQEHLAESVRVELVFEPRLALLARGLDSRIFLEKSIPDVVTEVIEGSGLDVVTEWATTATYEPHANIVQYGESDYDFIRRLLAEEGIGYAIRNDLDAERVIFFDDTTALEPFEDGTEVLYDGTTTGRTAADKSADRWRSGCDAAMLRDYDLTRAGADLSVTAEAPDSTAREHYDHPGGFPDTAALQRRVDRTLERLRRECETLETSTRIPHAEPLRKFTLDGHPRTDMLGDWQVVAARHVFTPTGAGSTEEVYRVELSCMRPDITFRPDALPAPRVGAQPAFVTVPPGEEIHTESFGRVKVRFPWDRSGITDDKSSTWLRVGQVALGGSMTLPRELPMR